MVVASAACVVRALLEGEPGFDDLSVDDLISAATHAFTAEDVSNFFAERVDPSMRFVVAHDSAKIDRTSWAMPEVPLDRYVQLYCTRPGSSTSAVASKLRRGVLRFAKVYDHIVLSIYMDRLNDDQGFMVSFTVIPARDAPEGYRPWWSLKKTERRWKDAQRARRSVAESEDDDFDFDLQNLESPTDFSALPFFLDRNKNLTGRYEVENVRWYEDEQRGCLTLSARKQISVPGGRRLRAKMEVRDAAAVMAAIREYMRLRGYSARIQPPNYLNTSELVPVTFYVYYGPLA